VLDGGYTGIRHDNHGVERKMLDFYKTLGELFHQNNLVLIVVQPVRNKKERKKKKKKTHQVGLELIVSFSSLC
jgi:hypothetical protein